MFVPGKPFQLGLMYISKAGALLGEVPYTLVYAPDLAHKH
jgi:hypothetical protein